MPTKTGLTPRQRSLRAQFAAFEQHARHDPRETTAKAREGFLAKFEVQVDPDRTLPEPERRRRAEAARRAHMLRLAFQSSRARSAKRKTAAVETAVLAEPEEVSSDAADEQLAG